MSEDKANNGLHRSIGWRQGFLIGIGIPLAIVPTIGFTVSFLWAASIVLWGMSVIQGFLQNMAFGELATAFPKVSGIPGFAQEIFKSKKIEENRFDRGRLIGGFCAWAYWLVWAPGLAVFIVLIGSYLQALFPALATTDALVFNLALGAVILGGLALLSSRGLKHSARLGLLIAIFTIIPIIIIVLAPFVTGNFHVENITNALVPAEWSWDADHIMLILGLMVIAQWSACCWEVVAIYGPEYKKPSSDVKKALFSVGIFCLVMYVLIQTSVVGALGVDGVLAQPISPLQPVAEMAFGSIGASVVILMLIGAMILLIQIGYSAAARAMHAMSLEGNLPRWFVRTNSRGEPMRAIYVIAVFNMLLILLGNPVAILAASAIGYVFAFAIGLFAYVKAHRDPTLMKLERPYKAPRGWVWIALALGILQIPLLLVGAIYINNLAYGIMPTLVGFGVLAVFFPLWAYSQRENRRLDKAKEDLSVEVETN
ncbi:MAG: APC family permease [Methanomassiliicoccales archaeon]|nr:APC family permease [Methanomassiliicoccales archaeon]